MYQFHFALLCHFHVARDTVQLKQKVECLCHVYPRRIFFQTTLANLLEPNSFMRAKTPRSEDKARLSLIFSCLSTPRCRIICPVGHRFVSTLRLTSRDEIIAHFGQAQRVVVEDRCIVRIDGVQLL